MCTMMKGQVPRWLVRMAVVCYVSFSLKWIVGGWELSDTGQLGLTTVGVAFTRVLFASSM